MNRRPCRRTANRVLDLEELQRPEFRNHISALESVCRHNPELYLHPSKRWEYPWALDRLGQSNGVTVLDAGCGHSAFPVYLRALGYHVVAVDHSVPKGLSGGDPGLHYVRGDLRALGVAVESFDTVFCISVIEHLPARDVSAAMAELHRVARPGGKLLLTTDYYERTDIPLFYTGPGEPFEVTWNVFDWERLRGEILESPGWRLEGDLDVNVEWERTSREMRAFHGYPYTSVGVCLVRCG